MNKKRERDKRQQRKAAKRKMERAKKAYQPKPASDPALGGFKRDHYLIWLAHGVNYLASSYDEGIWKPVVEESQIGSLDQETLLRKVIRLFWDDETEKWAPGSKPIAAWVLTPPKIAFVFYKEAERLVGEGTLFEAPNPHVWDFFSRIKSRLAQ